MRLSIRCVATSEPANVDRASLVRDNQSPPSSLRRKRGPWPGELCHGHEGLRCTLSLSEPDKPAAIHPTRGEKQCVFCDAERLKSQHSLRRNKIATNLQRMTERNPDQVETALARIAAVLGTEVISTVLSLFTLALSKSLDYRRLRTLAISKSGNYHP